MNLIWKRTFINFLDLKINIHFLISISQYIVTMERIAVLPQSDERYMLDIGIVTLLHTD